jgi:exonuclease III
MLILSWNVNGLRNVDKMKNVFASIKASHAYIACIQETFWDEEFIENYKHLWDGTMYYNNCQYAHRKGVAILISPQFSGTTNVTYRDEDGRVLRVTVTYEDISFNMYCIYSPNVSSDRIAFIDKLSLLISDTPSIISGDFNEIVDPHLDKSNTMSTYCYRSSTALVKFIDNHRLSDIWRYRHPEKKEFTRQQFVEGTLKQSRIDLILISKSLLVNVNNCYIKYSKISDHNSLCLKMDFNSVERGPGVWIFNNSLLNDPTFCVQIRNIIVQETKCPLFDNETIVWWDNFKYMLKRFSIAYSKQRKKEEMKEYYSIQNSLRKEYELA